jgi:thiol-disulfide isomerase/thioredoxin
MRHASPRLSVRAVVEAMSDPRGSGSTVVRVRRVGLLLVACVFLLGTAACSSSKSSAPQTLDATYSRFDGSHGSVSDFRGKPVVVNFFSSTCIPCQTEMPALEQIHRAAGDKIVFLGLDVQDTAASGRAFVQSVGVTWQMGRDPDASILQSLGGIGLPTTVLLDANGHIVYKHLGALQAGDLNKQLQSHGFLK